MSGLKHITNDLRTISTDIDFDYYDSILVQMSGGKDSIACFLHLLDLGVPKHKIEIWHQCIDGKDSTKKQFFDWESTEGYVRQFAKHFNVPLIWCWKEFGFWGEMHREEAFTNSTRYRVEGEKTEYILPTKSGKLSTRRKFPAKSANLNVRWCSSYLKIDVASKVIRNMNRFYGTAENPKKILMVTGERREESANRARYNKLEKFDTSFRIFHQYRAVIDWKEESVWAIMKRYKIMPHPAYYLGLPRLSCKTCIFFSPNHWATLNEIDPGAINVIEEKEKEFNHTLDNKKTIREMVNKGKSMITDENRKYAKMALSEFTHSIISENWQLPSGAYGHGGGAL